jgi:phosphoenolpyruvate synthase/pyruvate phosphate dikinase
MKWADEFRTMKVRTNADTPADAKKAVELGAEGIGLPYRAYVLPGQPYRCFP